MSALLMDLKTLFKLLLATVPNHQGNRAACLHELGTVTCRATSVRGAVSAQSVGAAHELRPP